MAAVNLSQPPFQFPFLDGPYVSKPWQIWLSAIYSRLGGATDLVDAAHTIASAAAPATAHVTPVNGLHMGGPIGTGVGLALYLAYATVADMPASAAEGDLAYAVNGRKVGEGAGAGTGMLCWWSNGHWNAVDTGAAVTA